MVNEIFDHSNQEKTLIDKNWDEECDIESEDEYSETWDMKHTLSYTIVMGLSYSVLREWQFLFSIRCQMDLYGEVIAYQYLQEAFE